MASFFAGDATAVVERLTAEMQAAAAAQEYEQAARIRDQLTAVSSATERQELVTERPDDFDVIAVAEDELEAALVVLNIRKGRITGRRATVVDRVEEVDTASLIGILLTAVYGSERPPKEVLVQALPDDAKVRAEWLAERRGSAVSLRVPQRGAKRRVLETAAENAAEEFNRHRLSDTPTTMPVPGPSTISRCPGPPDAAAAHRVLRHLHDPGHQHRRIDGGLRRRPPEEERLPPVQDPHRQRSGRLRRDGGGATPPPRRLPDRAGPAVEDRGRFAYPPSLIVVDGGAGQLGRAVAVLSDLELDIPAVGLAKRLEEVYVPGRMIQCESRRGGVAVSPAACP